MKTKSRRKRLGNEGEVRKAVLKAGRPKYAQIGKCIYKKGSETRQDRNGRSTGRLNRNPK
jgi:hypothetical protein